MKVVVKPIYPHHRLSGTLLLGSLAALAYPLQDVLAVLCCVSARSAYSVWRSRYLVELELGDDDVGGGDGDGNGLT